MEGLLNERMISQTEFDRTNADYRQSDARVGEVRTAIDRKTIRAPFSDLLGIRHANLGQYLSASTALITLQSLDPIYVNFSVPQQAMTQITQGREVHVTAADAAGAAFSNR